MNTLTPQMFSIYILCFMSNFSFKGDTLFRLNPSGGIDLFIPRIILWWDTISRETGAEKFSEIYIAMITLRYLLKMISLL